MEIDLKYVGCRKGDNILIVARYYWWLHLKFLSFKAADFYYTNRYASHEECTNPCSSMEVSTNLKYKVKTKSDGEIILFFPKEIEIIEETLLKSFSQFGNFLKSIFIRYTQIFSFFLQLVRLVATLGWYWDSVWWIWKFWWRTLECFWKLTI